MKMESDLLFSEEEGLGMGSAGELLPEEGNRTQEYYEERLQCCLQFFFFPEA